MPPSSILTLWECGGFRCVVIVSKETPLFVVQVWKSSDVLRDVKCTTAGEAATVADLLFHEICESPR